MKCDNDAVKAMSMPKEMYELPANDELTKRCVYLCSVICKERETERLAIRGGA